MRITKIIVSLVLVMLVAVPCIFGGCNLGNNGLTAITVNEIKQAMNGLYEKVEANSETGAGTSSVNLSNGAKNEGENTTSSIGLPYSMYEDEISTDDLYYGFTVNMEWLKGVLDPLMSIINDADHEFKPYEIYVDDTFEDMIITCMVSVDLETRTVVAYYSVSKALYNGIGCGNFRFELQLTEDYSAWEKMNLISLQLDSIGGKLGCVMEIVNDVDNIDRIETFNYMRLEDDEDITDVGSFEFNINKYLSLGGVEVTDAMKEALYDKYFASKIVYLDFITIY